MNELIESGDPRAKVVGKRRAPEAGDESLRAGGEINRVSEQIRAKPLRLPRGVYKFRSHEEADAWLMKYQTH